MEAGTSLWSLSGRCRKTCERVQAVLQGGAGDRRPELDHQPDPVPVEQQPGVLEWITVDDHQVGELPLFDGANVIAKSKGLPGDGCRGGQGLTSAQPVVDHSYD